MKNLLKIMAVVLVGTIATGCASNNDKADEALRVAQEAKNIAEATQAQFTKYYGPSRYK